MRSFGRIISDNNVGFERNQDMYKRFFPNNGKIVLASVLVLILSLNQQLLCMEEDPFTTIEKESREYYQTSLHQNYV